jgi:hypothetical protein
LEEKQRASKWLIIGFILQVGIILYWEITEYADLFPFNDVSRNDPEESFHASLANDLPKLLILILLVGGLRWMTSSGYLFAFGSSLIYYIVFLGIQITVWWPRYLFGASPEELQKYNEKFARTIKILPSFGNHVAVDLQHNILQLWTLAIILVMAVTLKKLLKARKLDRRQTEESGSKVVTRPG